MLRRCSNSVTMSVKESMGSDAAEMNLKEENFTFWLIFGQKCEVVVTGTKWKACKGSNREKFDFLADFLGKKSEIKRPPVQVWSWRSSEAQTRENSLFLATKSKVMGTQVWYQDPQEAWTEGNSPFWPIFRVKKRNKVFSSAGMI